MTTEEPPVTALASPTVAEARDLVREGIDEGVLVTLVGRCRVVYEGRATGTLGPGERHVMLKPDGTALVHTDEGQKPVNWQPPGADHAVAVAEDLLVVRSERAAPSERLVVRFDRVDQAAAVDLTDHQDRSVNGTEADLRQRLLAEPSLLEEGFTPLATERATPAGAVDVYGEDAAGRAVVVELKRRRVGPDAVGQLDRYVTALERDLHEGATVRGVLVAPSATDRAGDLLAERDLEFVALAPTPEGEDSATEVGAGGARRPSDAE